VEFTVPPSRFGEGWAVVFDTSTDGSPERRGRPDLRPGDHLQCTGGSVALLRRTAAEAPRPVEPEE
jgi:hypothetical protein